MVSYISGPMGDGMGDGEGESEGMLEGWVVVVEKGDGGVIRAGEG